MTSFASMVFRIRQVYLGINDKKAEQTKGPYEFLMADFRKLHRCGLSRRGKPGGPIQALRQSNARQRICMACWMAGRVRRLRSAQRRHR